MLERKLWTKDKSIEITVTISAPQADAKGFVCRVALEGMTTPNHLEVTGRDSLECMRFALDAAYAMLRKLDLPLYDEEETSWEAGFPPPISPFGATFMRSMALVIENETSRFIRELRKESEARKNRREHAQEVLAKMKPDEG